MYAFVCRFFLCITICVCLGADGADAALVLQRRIHRSVDLSAGMASGGDEAMAAAAAVDGPKKIAKPGRRRNSVEVIGPCLCDIPHLLCSFFYGAEAVF